VIDVELDLRRLEAEIGVGEMNMPLSFADFSTSATTSASCRKSCVVVMTNWTGGPPVDPGNAGGENEIACAVARLEMRGDKSCSTCFWLRSRSPHGFSKMPEKPWCTLPMPLMVNTCSFSGTLL